MPPLGVAASMDACLRTVAVRGRPGRGASSYAVHMLRHALRLCCALVLTTAVACAASTPRDVETPVPSPSATVATSTPAPSATPSPTPTPRVPEIRASRLAIPSLKIDAPVGLSTEIPDTYPRAPGCPVPPPGATTLTVPNHGIVTPDKSFEGMESVAWIFGHSRWEGAPGLLFGLQDLNIGDEVFVEGVDRVTQAPIERRRFIVDGLYLTDLDSGGTLVTTEPARTPSQSVVMLQTSVREEGAGKPWILSQQKLLAKARNLIQGDMNDPCKYLLLFVSARPS